MEAKTAHRPLCNRAPDLKTMLKADKALNKQDKKSYGRFWIDELRSDLAYQLDTNTFARWRT